LFDRINSYKEVLYDSFIQHIGPNASVQVFFHHYDVVRFNNLIRENLRRFNYYVIMPHFNHDVSEVLMKIPEKMMSIKFSLSPKSQTIQQQLILLKAATFSGIVVCSSGK